MTTPEDIFARGMAAFEGRHPDLWRRLVSLGTPVSRPVIEGGEVVNVDLGDGTLYPRPASAWTAAQVESHLADPDRLRAPDPGGARPSHVIRDFLPRLEGWLAERAGGPLPGQPVAQAGFAFVFGVGLGHHVAEFIRRDIARHLVLVEPVPELLLHSLAALDWEAVLLEAETRGIRLHWLVGLDPEATTRAIEALLIASRGGTFIDGAHAFVHYPSWANRQARLLLNQRLGNFLLRPNTFDDEILMLRNAYANLGRWSFRLLDLAPRPRLDIPTFIVASGPSLDRDLEHLARLRSQALVISCGSALGILLGRGIRPDFHIENENTPPLVRNLETFRAEHGLEGIRLLASATVEARAAGLFEERWLYLRALSSPSAVFNSGSRPLPFTGPLAANAALAAAVAMGLGNLYLFGVDCGRRVGRGHHASGAIYNRPGYDNFIAGESQAMLEDELELLVPGNFGGEIQSSAYMDLSRRTIGELLRLRPLSCINCSDGARIDGARPQAAAALKLEHSPNRQAEAIAAIAAGLQTFEAGVALGGAPIARHRAACKAFAEAWPRVVAGASDCWDLEIRLSAFREQYLTVLEGLMKMIGGSLSLMLRLAAWHEARLADVERRRAFFAFFQQEFTTAGADLAGDADVLLNLIQERAPEDVIAERFAERYPLSRHAPSCG
ncbi:MAG: DUF115 domain-containing protein [Magnetospirillum sp. WYHS-4]